MIIAGVGNRRGRSAAAAVEGGGGHNRFRDADAVGPPRPTEDPPPPRTGCRQQEQTDLSQKHEGDTHERRSTRNAAAAAVDAALLPLRCALP